MDLEVELDHYLKIKTNGRDDSQSNFINYPYEATPYCVLQALANSGYVTKRDTIIDFGCGKGRVDFFLAYATKAKMIGVEFDERLYNTAILNKTKAISANRTTFVKSCASLYQIPDEVTGVYFFNPFNTDILQKVIANLKESIKKNKRKIKMFFYYPSNKYLDVLNDDEQIMHLEDIDCIDMFKEYNEREYIAIYELS